MQTPSTSVIVALVLGVVAMTAATSFALYRNGLAVGVSRRKGRIAAGSVVAALLAWAVVSAGLAHDGAYLAPPDALVPLVAVSLFATLAIALLAAKTGLIAACLADRHTPARLAAVQSLRVLGVVFLIAMAQGDLPAAFALPAGLGDIAVGVAAPFVARRLVTGNGRTAALWFNTLGILDLVVAVTIGFLLAPSRYQLVDVAPSISALLLLPLVLIPTVAVPISAALHVLSLRALSTTRGCPAS